MDNKGQCFFILGSEGSGTRMLTQAFIRVGCYGDSGHQQKLDHEIPKKDKIVWRRSVPHGKEWVNYEFYYNKLIKTYKVYPILIFRDKDYTVFSQLKGKVDSGATARTNILKAIEHIYNEVAKTDAVPYVISYEAFTTSKLVRKLFFRQFGLPEPEMEFYNANCRY